MESDQLITNCEQLINHGNLKAITDVSFKAKVLPSSLFTDRRIGMFQPIIEEIKDNRLICRYCNWKFEVNYEKIHHEKMCPLNMSIRKREGLIFNYESFTKKLLSFISFKRFNILQPRKQMNEE
ncbi:uncharacterized protein LOC127286442 isoform X2 [Leptopilina boulardi]|uniref:uncharacterized protein LOC127286442 isoform X2 n=1 Tax=Leptopilina boulardi TaxID=63433 RepID=UPI0021F582AA|nr:uncharacterized protein LOC127286442 isoform X2 [Leptopilina boulardi]